VGLAGGRTGLRTSTRWIRAASAAGFGEDWTLVLLGVAVVIVTIGLAVLTALTVHQRDALLQDATAAAHRLSIGGLDDNLYQNLITTQQDEVALFQARIDAAGQAGPGLAAPGHDPRADLDRVESGLTAINGQFADSPRVRRDITLISREMSRYTGLEATAQADNQQGLPVGAAYLREASGYLTASTLPSADDIRRVDQARIAADDAAASALPWPLLVVDILGLACLAGAQILTARYTRRLFNPGLVLATILTAVVIAWSITSLSISLHVVGSDTAPHAEAAAALAQARVDGIQAHTDDLLTLVDHGEDCSASTTTNPQLADPYVYIVTCTFETQVVKSLTAPRGQLRTGIALAARETPDPSARAQIAAAAAAAISWLAAENRLPTLQNLESEASHEPAGSYPRYNTSFVTKVLAPYATPDPQHDGTAVRRYSQLFQNAVKAAIEHEWESYDARAGSAGNTLGGLVTGALLLGLLAGGVAGGGIGWRVNEYWSAGRRTS
jgi:hypothetical protein